MTTARRLLSAQSSAQEPLVFAPSTSDAAVSAYRGNVEFRVLGPIEVLEADKRKSVGGPKQRTLLALIIANAGHVVSTDRIIEGIWGDEPPAGARRSLHTYVSNLRGELGDVIRRESEGYVLAVAREAIDAIRFEDLVFAGSDLVESDPEEALRVLRQALGLWRGHPFADVDGRGAFESEITRLSELRLAALHERIEADLALGRHIEIIGELEALTVEHPLQEGFRAQHMLALYRAGRQAEALRAFERTRSYLVEELGINPTAELRKLEQQILDHDPDLDLDPGPSIRHVAVLVVDVGDASGLMRLDPINRERLVTRMSEMIEAAVVDAGGSVFAQRGTAHFAWFDDLVATIGAAGALQASGFEAAAVPRIAIDIGDVESDSNGVLSGPPVTRAASLVAAAHTGQVLLSTESHRVLVGSEEEGWHVRALGSHRLVGLDRPESVYQLTVEGRPLEFPPLRTDLLPPRTPVASRDLPGYELRGRVGSGAVGDVFRAYQPAMGREVAVKVIKPELANDPGFVRRFEVEALLVSRLEHPHIVPVLDFWRDPEGAFLVMRWIRGGNLEDLLADGPLDAELALRIIQQIGEALEAAHRNGVIHRDIKAANVLLDEDGNGYLTDFGIAQGLLEESGVSVASDLGAFGALVGEMLNGNAPPGISQIVDRTSTHGSENQFPSVAEFVGALERHLGSGSSPAHRVLTPTRNPYKGLAAFTEADANDFHGREASVAQILEAVERSRLVAVVGPSGIGKSSVVRAGVIPVLRRGQLIGSSKWFITDMLPGRFPFEELGTALLRVATDQPTALDDDLRRDDRGIARAIKRMLPPDGELLLVIDQFEELFTLTDADTRRLFLAGLTTLVKDDRSKTRVLLTIRADFFDHPLHHPGMGELLRASTIPVGAPSTSEMLAMVAAPAAALGVDYEPGLADRIVSNVSDQPGSLPLLEYALTELFDARSSDEITAAAYHESGGVLGALGRRAESTYQSLPANQQEISRQVFLRLVSVDESGRDTRRRLRRSELGGRDVADDSVDTVLTAFGDHRLLTFDRDLVTRGRTIEVAHEALFSEWARLNAWIAERRQDLLLRRRLQDEVQEWEQADREDSYLLDGGRLAQHESWTSDTDLLLSVSEKDLLATSRQRETERADQRNRRRRGILAGFAAAAVIALSLATVAWVLRGVAQEEASLAQARELIGDARATLDFDPDLSGLLALSAVEAFDSARRETPGEAVTALRSFIAAQRIKIRVPGGDFVAVHPYRPLLATAEGDEVAVWDMATGEIAERYSRNEGVAAEAAFSPDGTLLVVMYRHADPPVAIWDLTSGDLTELGTGVIGDLPTITFSHDGQLFAFGSEGQGVEVWFTESREQLHEIEGFGPHFGSHDSLSVGYCSSDFETCEVRSVDPYTGTADWSIPVEGILPLFTAWSPDGLRLAVADQSTAIVFDALNGEEISRTDVDRVYRPRWLPSGDAFVVGGETVPRLIDATSGEVLLELTGIGGAYILDIVPGELQMASAALKGDTAVFDISELGGLELGGWVASVGTTLHAGYATQDRVFVADRESVVSAGAFDGRDPVVLAGEPSDWFPLPGREGSLTPLAEPNGQWVVRRIDTGDVVYRAPEGWVIRGVDADNARAVLFQGDLPNEYRTLLVSTVDGSILAEVESGYVAKVEFSPDGALVVLHNLDESSAPFAAAVFDAETGALLRPLEWSAYIGLVADFTEDGTRLVVGGESGSLTVFDVPALLSGVPLEQAALLEIPAHDTNIIIVDVSPDGSMAFSSTRNEPLKLWSLESGQLLGEFGGIPPSGSRNVGGFHPTLPQLMVASPPNLVRIHTLDVDELVDIARSRLTREFTEEECQLYLRRTCAG